MAKNRVEKKVPPIFTFWVVSYMPCQFDKFDKNIKKNSRNTIKTWLCRQLMWQPWSDVTQYTMWPKIWAKAVPDCHEHMSLTDEGRGKKNQVHGRLGLAEKLMAEKLPIVCKRIVAIYLILLHHSKNHHSSTHMWHEPRLSIVDWSGASFHITLLWCLKIL